MVEDPMDACQPEEQMGTELIKEQNRRAISRIGELMRGLRLIESHEREVLNGGRRSMNDADCAEQDSKNSNLHSIQWSPEIG
jgi:hypothetical protein